MLIITNFVIITMSAIYTGFYMNLHEECLLKYLKFPDGISTATETLKLHNLILERKFVTENFVAKFTQIHCTK